MKKFLPILVLCLLCSGCAQVNSVFGSLFGAVTMSAFDKDEYDMLVQVRTDAKIAQSSSCNPKDVLTLYSDAYKYYYHDDGYDDVDSQIKAADMAKNLSGLIEELFTRTNSVDKPGKEYCLIKTQGVIDSAQKIQRALTHDRTQ